MTSEEVKVRYSPLDLQYLVLVGKNIVKATYTPDEAKDVAYRLRKAEDKT